MDLPIPVNTPQTPATVTIDHSRAALTLELLDALQIGKVLDVSVRPDASGSGLQLLILGNLVTAALPKGTKSGDRLTVEVLSNTDQLKLKILEQKSSTPDSAKPQSVPIDFEITRDLHGLLENLKTFTPVKQALPLSSNLEPAKIRESFSGDFSTQNLLLNLLEKNQLLSGQAFENPSVLSKALQTSNTNELIRTVIQAKEALIKLAGGQASPPAIDLIKNLQQTLSEALENKGPFAIPAATTSAEPKSKEFLLKILTTLGESLDETQNEIVRSKNPRDKIIQEFLSETKNELRQLRDEELTEPRLKDFYRKILQQISSKLELTPKRVEDAENLSKAIKLISSLENLSKTQETLEKLNPLMQSMGEPALILFPTIAQGLLTKWEMTVKVDSEDKNNPGRKSVECFQRIQLNIPLPNMGSVQADLAFRKKELYLNLIFSSPEASKFVEERRDKLDILLRALGYDSTTIIIASGEPQAISPDWYKKLSTIDHIIA